MKKFLKAKEKYRKIDAPESLKRKVTFLGKRKKSKAVVIKTAAAAACIAASFVTALNVSPQFAYAMSGIPIMKSIVSVVTFSKYEHNENGYSAKVAVPKIEGLLDKDLQDKLNNEFAENANAIIAAYENDVRELKEAFGDETVHLGIESDYEIKTDNDKILALDVYIFTAAGSSNTVHSFYNIDKVSGTLIELADMFKPGSDYVTPISEYITGEMKRINADEDGMFWIAGDEEFFDGFEKIKSDQNFYIKSNGNIVICFDKYEVAAGAQGCPEFEIPNSVIKDILVRR